MNFNCSNLLDMRNLQEQVKKAFQKLFWPFTVRTNCSSVLNNFTRSLEQFLLTVGQNNFGNKIPFLPNKLENLSFSGAKKNLSNRPCAACSRFLSKVWSSDMILHWDKSCCKSPFEIRLLLSTQQANGIFKKILKKILFCQVIN